MQTETTLVGRAAELALIEGALDEVQEGQYRVLAISGEPGIGKTRLLSELAVVAARLGKPGVVRARHRAGA
jgi:predicted ATPase